MKAVLSLFGLRMPGVVGVLKGMGFMVGEVTAAELATIPCDATREGEERRTVGSGATPSSKWMCEWDGAAFAWTQHPVTVTDTASINLTLTGRDITAAANFNTTAGTVAEGNHTHAATSPVIYRNPSVSTAVASTANETLFDRNVTILANALAVGDVLRITAAGFHDNTATPTLQLRVRWGGLAGTLLGDTGAVGMSDTNDKAWSLCWTGVVLSIGASGTIAVGGPHNIMKTNPVTESTASNFACSVITIDTTTDKVLGITADWSVSSSSNTTTLRSIVIEHLQA